MYKLIVLASVLACSQATLINAGLTNLPYPYATGLGLNGALAYNKGYAGPALAATPLAAPALAAPALATNAYAVAPAVAAPAPLPTVAATGAIIGTPYAVPAPRVIEEAPIVEKVVEPVEQWGVIVRY